MEMRIFFCSGQELIRNNFLIENLTPGEILKIIFGIFLNRTPMKLIFISSHFAAFL